MHKILLVFGLTLTTPGCGFPNLITDAIPPIRENREQWYEKTAEERNRWIVLVESIQLGMTKEEVLEILGEPLVRRSGDNEWVYKHPYFVTREFITFKDGKVINVRSH